MSKPFTNTLSAIASATLPKSVTKLFLRAMWPSKKSDKEASGCLFLEFDKAMQRVSFLNLPMGVDPFWVQSCQAVPPATEPGPDGVRVCEKTMQIEDGKAIDVKIIVDHDMIEAFIDEQIAFTYRIYAKPEFETGIIAQDSNVEFYNLSISGK